MGWYTELKIGNKSWSWRKNLPVEVPLLFYGKHKIIDKDIDYLEYDGFIGYEATVGQVISNLNTLGLTLDFFKSTYNSYRSGLIIYGIAKLEAIKTVYQNLEDNTGESKKKIRDAKDWITKIKNGSSSTDIDCAISALKDKVKFESMLLHDETIIPSLNYLSGDIDLNEPNILEATTFGIFLSYAHENLPEIAWLFEIRIVLESLNKQSKVKLDLKEWVSEGGELDIIENSLESLALKAKTYMITFDAILGGNETYNREFKRVQLTDKWHRLKSLKHDDISKGNRLEEFIAELFHNSFGFYVAKKNLLIETQELDIVLKNVSKNEFIKTFVSPFILIECKNWTTPVGVAEARVFESKYRELGKKVQLGFFIALNGVTKPFKTHLNNLIRDEINTIVIDQKSIESYLYSESLDLDIWLEQIITELDRKSVV